MTDEELSGWLEDVVVDTALQEAAEINNAGLQKQLDYLGVTRAEAEREAT